ncbi:MAG: flagellar hook assembly protein FlgD [Alphaproteobacteria bacterium]
MTNISYVSPDTTTPASSAANNKADGNDNGISEQQKVFLDILLTQLENQNPLDPVDTTEFTNQLVAYSSLEQEMTINENLETIISSLNDYNTVSAFSYIGADVELNSSTAVMQDDEAKWEYVLKDDAEKVVLQVANSNGDVVASFDVQAGETGTYSFGVSSADLAQPVEEGEALTLTVRAKDPEGEDIRTKVLSFLTIEGAEMKGDDVSYMAGEEVFSANDIISIRKERASL